MAQQNIALGTTANDGTGDTARAAGGKINANFTELYTGAHVHSATGKTSLADSDEFSLQDSAASYGLKKVTFGNLKTDLQTAYSLVFAPISHAHSATDITSGVMTLNVGGLGTTTSPAYCLTNATAAAVNAQQVSPSIKWSGRGWKTAATAASQATEFQAFVLPVQGATAPTAQLKFQYSVNGGAFADAVAFTSTGQGLFNGGNYNVPWISTAGGYVGLGSGNSTLLQFIANNAEYAVLNHSGFGIGSAHYLGWTSGATVGNLSATKSRIYSPADNTIQFGETTATPLDYLLRGASGIGTNIAAADLCLSGGISTGSAVSGALRFQASASGASGSAAQTLYDVLAITDRYALTISDGVVVTIGSTDGLLIGSQATQKLGFFDTTPVVQPTNVSTITVTNNGDFTGSDMVAQGAIETRIIELQNTLNAVNQRLQSLGLIAD